MMIMNLFVAVVIEGFQASCSENSGVVTSTDYKILIEKWSIYDPKATGFITPKDLAFLVYDLDPPLGKKSGKQDKDYTFSSQSAPSNMQSILDVNLRYINHDKNKSLILSQQDVMKTLASLSVPVYKN